jgi:hypothetical protein
VAVRVAAAAAAVAVCVTGTVYAIGRTKFKPEKETLATSDEAPVLLDNTASATEGTVPDTTGEAPDKEVNEYLKCWKPFELDGWTFKVDMLHITKSSRGMTFRQNEYYPCDEKGVFTCDQSYIVADMTVTNNSGEDREYYTNSFHVPVYYPIKAYKKIQLEAPYHAMTNAGHISYVELDGDTCKNLKAFEAVIRYMKEAGIGYGSVNHPVDRDPICGYTGVIDDVCQRCGRREGEPVTIERLNELRMRYPSVPVPCDCNR